MVDYITFPLFFIFNLLNEAGWPRLKGVIFKKQVVSGWALQSSVNQLIQVGVVLGAVNPNIAIRLFAEMFRNRDFSKNPPDDFWMFFNKHSDLELDKLDEPIWSHINPLKNIPETIPFEDIKVEKVQAIIYGGFLFGLGYGLNNNEKAINAYESDVSKIKSEIPRMLEAGLDIDPDSITKPINEYEANCLEIIKDFERKVHPLAEPSKELIEFPVFARRLGLHS
mgnify:CR=1 FL=1